MRNLAKKYSKVFASLVVGVLLTFCLFATASAHQPSPTSTSKASCSSSCHSHQAISGVGIDQKEQDDDKEPVPPPFYWQLGISNLAALYIAPFLALVPIALLRKKFILSTQLRI